MTDSIEERLKTHSNAFDGLLSLIPAKHLYDGATKDQWQSKKKSKQEALENRRAKLDPDAVNADTYNNGGATAKDVMENRAKNAKRVTLPGKNLQNGETPKIKNAGAHHNGDESVTESKEAKKEQPKKEQPKKEQPKKGQAKKEHPKKEQPKKEEPKSEEPKNEAVAKKDTKPAKKVLTPEEQQLRDQKRAEMKEKLAQKIELMREKRKAPGTKAGGPVKSREQMLAERKRKEEYKRQEKLKRKRESVESDKSDDEDNEDEDNADENENRDGFLFGTIQFKDGTRMTSDLQNFRNGVDRKKKKGPANKDIKAHLQKLEAKRRKLDTLSPEEKKAKEKQDQWTSLMNQAEGIKVKDNEKLLKKSLKRKEKQKLRSEIEWKERKQTVKDTINARQKRKEANLKSRRENKGKKSKNIPKLRSFTGTVSKGGKGGKDGKKRAGFEGNAKSKGKGKSGK